MTKKLDRKKSFGEIFGDDEGRRYEQDGVFFDANEEAIVTEKAVPKGKRKPAADDPTAPAPAETTDQLESQLLD